MDSGGIRLIYQAFSRRIKAALSKTNITGENCGPSPRHTGIDSWKRYCQTATSITYGGQPASVASIDERISFRCDGPTFDLAEKTFILHTAG
jgi:hypothetical protein